MRKPAAATKQEQGTTQPTGKGGKEMASVGRIVSHILVALSVIVGHASAHTMSDYDYIRQHLTVGQGTWIDTDGDHIGNVLGYDVNLDGNWDAYRFSTCSNGYLNGVALDLSDNNSFSSVKFYVDTTGSGRFNVAFAVNASGQYYALDRDEDGHYTAWASLTVPMVQSAPQPTPTSGGMPIQVAQFMHESNTRIINTWLAPRCNSSYYGYR